MSFRVTEINTVVPGLTIIRAVEVEESLPRIEDHDQSAIFLRFSDASSHALLELDKKSAELLVGLIDTLEPRDTDGVHVFFRQPLRGIIATLKLSVANKDAIFKLEYTSSDGQGVIESRALLTIMPVFILQIKQLFALNF